jgi:hypothetical protein
MPPNKERPDWQGIWERLRKLGIEFDENRRNGIVEAFERLPDSTPIGGRSLLERYVKHHMAFHVHLRVGCVGGTGPLKASKLCATFEWPRGVFLQNLELEFWSVHFHMAESEHEVREMKVAMLVGVPEFLQDRKRLLGRILPVRKRLQPLDVCAKSWPDSPEAIRWLPSPGDASTRGIPPTGVEGVDGEADAPPLVVRVFSSEGNNSGRRVSVRQGKLPNEMVERRAEVVDDITDDRPPFLHRRLPEGFTVEDYLACFYFNLGVDSVSVAIDERLDPFIQQAHVHIRPLDLRPTSIQRVAHGC